MQNMFVLGFVSQCSVYRGGTESSHSFQEFAFTKISYATRYYFCPGTVDPKHIDLNNLQALLQIHLFSPLNLLITVVVLF